jgi:hypothetical protein
MEKQRTKDGVHQGRRDESNKYTADDLHLMKTQDVKYIGLKASMEAGAGGYRLRPPRHRHAFKSLVPCLTRHTDGVHLFIRPWKAQAKVVVTRCTSWGPS